MAHQTTPDPVSPSSVGDADVLSATSAADPPAVEAAAGASDGRLGPFEVDRVLGRGGMSVVLAGSHHRRDVPVAIKIITIDPSEDPKRRTRLRDEVQAAAGLNHPGVVRVLDYGELDAPADDLIDAPLPTGTPYYVMERTRKGTLADIVGRVRWRQAESLLLSILDALAHAHGTGIVHRDIKPSNILLDPWGGRIIPKLADFGIAFAMQNDGSSSESIGTPRYMAPEQIEQPWRRHGPWSDLYSLGCIAFELVSGDKLFDADELDDIYRQHLVDEQPTVDPLVPVPDGFQDWLDRMLARSPDERFQTAADAASALSELDTASVPDVPPPGASQFDCGEFSPVLAPILDDDGPADDEPSIPVTWPETPVDQRSMEFTEAGLGLYSLRSPPLVGRDAELDQLWRAFRETRDDSPRTMVVRGRRGCGKTRLVEWFTERLRELGAATVLRATHSDGEPAKSDGLSGMLARHFRTVGASDTETEKVVRAQLADYSDSPFDWQTMTQIVEPSLASETLQSLGIQIAQPSQRYAVVARYLEHLAESRPVVLWCDDAEWANDTLEFLQFLQKRRGDDTPPILAVATATDEHLADRADDGDALRELVEAPAADELPLEPLDPVDHERLVEELLHLEGELARDVVQQTSGNPLFAVELIGDWVHGGVLEVGDGGFTLRDGVDPEIPDHLHDIWVRRARAVLDDYGEEARLALEIAAALGERVQSDEWRAVCTIEGIDRPSALVGDLAERRLADRTEDGWRFAHAMLRRSVERLARRADRWRRHCRACAAMVADRYDLDRMWPAERFGRFAVRADQNERALEPLYRAARARRQRGEYRATQQLLSDYLGALDALGAPDSDTRRGRAWLTRARTHLNDRQPREAEQWARRTLEAAREHDWDELEPRALGWLGLAAQWLGDERAPDYLHEAAELVLEKASPDERRSGVYGSIAQGLTRLREFDRSVQLLELDRRVAEAHDDERALANNRYLWCRHAFYREDWEAALEHAREAHDLSEAAGHLPGVGLCREAMAEIHRRLGNPERAEDMYRSCIELQRTIGHPQALSQLNLAIIRVLHGDAEGAERLFVEARNFFESSGRRMHSMVATAGVLACAAAREWWGNIRDPLDELESGLSEISQGERDLAELLEFAGDRLEDAERRPLARRTYELARQQWKWLDVDDRLETVTEKLEAGR